ncbi:MAG: DUF190 domain-containing protein [Proteobacteria bacterium]|nr:DUF190 domain-containing protein [Pseudomonadota bacterium]
MKLDPASKMLRIYIGEEDRHNGEILHEVIVKKAIERGMAGATVFRAIEGYGAHSRMRSEGILRLSADLPIIVVLVDKPERIESFIPILDDIIKDGLVTVEDIEVVLYRSASRNKLEESTELPKDAEMEQIKEEVKEEVKKEVKEAVKEELKESLKDEIKEEIMEAVIDAAKEEIEEDF